MELTQNLSIIVALGAGLFSFLSPCLLPLLPSYLSYITGMSFEELQGQGHIRKMAMLHSLFFILGFSTVFVVLGASFSLLGGLLAGYQGGLQKVAGLIIIFFGLYIVGVLKIPFLMRSKEIITLKNKPAFAWTPCVGPILGAILALAGTAKRIGSGVVLLTAYSIGLAIPFFLTSLAAQSFLRIFQKNKNFFHAVYLGGGIILIIVGILIFTGYFTALNSLLTELTPSWLWEKI
jgi:cytochrome c-type biogenesis protein